MDKRWKDWVIDYWVDITTNLWHGLIGLTELILFFPLVPINIIAGLYLKIRCDFFHKHSFRNNNYCYYCRKMKDVESE